MCTRNGWGGSWKNRRGCLVTGGLRLRGGAWGLLMVVLFGSGQAPLHGGEQLAHGAALGPAEACHQLRDPAFVDRCHALESAPARCRQAHAVGAAVVRHGVAQHQSFLFSWSVMPVILPPVTIRR